MKKELQRTVLDAVIDGKREGHINKVGVETDVAVFVGTINDGHTINMKIHPDGSVHLKVDKGGESVVDYTSTDPEQMAFNITDDVDIPWLYGEQSCIRCCNCRYIFKWHWLLAVCSNGKIFNKRCMRTSGANFY